MQPPAFHIFLVRSVLAACFALAAILPGDYYYPVPVVPLVFLHHVLMPIYLGSAFKLADVLLLPFDITGVAFLIWGLASEGEYICILTCLLTCLFLTSELLSRIGWLLGVRLSYSYAILLDVRSVEKYNFLQSILGNSFSMGRFRGEEPTPNTVAEYGIPAKQTRLLFRARICVLRIILGSCCSFLALVPAVWNLLGDISYQYGIQLIPFVFVHHLLSCIHMEFDYILFDFPFLLFEITSLGFHTPTLGSFGFDWTSPLLNCYTILACVILVALVLEACIWTCILFWRKASQQPSYNCFTGAGSMSLGIIPRPHNILFGPWLWKAHLSGETRIIRGIRGLIAVAITLLILSYSVLDLIFYPFQNTGLNYFKDLRSSGIPDTFPLNNLAWNVVIISPPLLVNPFNWTSSESQWGDKFSAAFNVTYLWSTETSLGSPVFGHAPCAYTSNTTTFRIATFEDGILGNITEARIQPIDTIFCPQWPNDGYPSSATTISFEYIMPDILIQMNFTALNISAGRMSDMARNSVQVMIGFHNDTSKVVQTTQSMTLVPGINILGCITYELRQTLKNSFAPDLGLSNTYDTFAVSKMLYAIPDPLASVASSLIKQAPDISTFRVFLQHDFSDLKTLQSYKEQDTLGGFAAVGGLWTFLSGTFAAIFGSSLLRILFGIKPISLTGFAHSIEREKIQEACRREYPSIGEEIHLPPEERGLLSLLCDQLIDVDFLEREGKKADGSGAQMGREDIEINKY